MRYLFFLIVSISAFSLHAQTVLLEENFNSGIPSNWAVVNADNLTPASAVSEFTNAWISFNHNGDTCAASTSFYSPEGQSADYLITPKLSIPTFSKLVWSAQSYDASFPDGYVVLISTTDSLIGSFTDTLLSVTEEIYYWQTRSVQIDLEGYANQDVYIAFKNITNDGYILMIDDVSVLVSDFATVTEKVKPAVTIYPNPTHDLIFVDGLESGDLITIYSAIGQVVLTSYEREIDLSNLESGIYLYTIQSKSGKTSGTVVRF